MRRLLPLALALLALLVAATPAAYAQSASADQAVAWMRQQQQPDGSFPGFGVGDTADAVAALVAAGQRPADFVKEGNSPLDYLKAQAATYAASGPGAAAKLVLAAVAAGENPTNFGTTNLLGEIGSSYDPATGQYGPDLYGHALALLAVKAVGGSVPDVAVQRTLALQLPDGGWSFDGTAATGSDTNTTGLVLQALAGTSTASEAISKAVAYLKAQQNDDGGFPYARGAQSGSASDANSTAAVIQALLAVGEQPASADWTKGSNTPLTTLAGFQNPSGAFRFQASAPDDNGVATYQALPALVGRHLPVATTTVSGATALLVPAAQPATQPARLPTTATPGALPVAPLALAAVALLVAGVVARRRSAL